jgi:hypothetical protein
VAVLGWAKKSIRPSRLIIVAANVISVNLRIF